MAPAFSERLYSDIAPDAEKNYSTHGYISHHIEVYAKFVLIADAYSASRYRRVNERRHIILFARCYQPQSGFWE